ncbi:MAG: TIGR01458 family HAD-type hydrolase [Rhodocyclales bacterium]|nr:TIGR01458 family HAD-type hydrolase [Rhodocyclales bacterium]
MALPHSPEAVLIDLAGVLHNGDQAIPGAVEALRALRASGLPLRFLTNTTRSPRRRILTGLQGMGFAIEADEIQTAVVAARTLVAERRLHPHYLVHPDIIDEIGASHAEPDAVVLGDAGPQFNFDNLNRVFRLLMRGLPFIVMARNRYFMEPDGLSLDMGTFVAGLEYSTGRQAEVVGKPALPFFQAALRELGAAAARTVLVGDDLTDDIGGAQAAGMAGLLVRTGKYRPQDEAHDRIHPDAVCDDFPAAVAAILAA